ncbi:hypothetical protein R3W88_024101 [Solanum pinnatisectum]|uniref:Uncharacterized protein n=1 Tax=Solanum pinnatisectum TaxID=50273 RepID=A0AAV9M097_9SOLN|nr:hypothetical protein R3W88_024101 [Solanum pinnatisectum]
MEEIIFTKIYHGGILSEIFVPTYVGNCAPALRYIIKDHFSILELLYYTKELGLKLLEDTFEVFVCHVLDEPLLDIKGPTSYLTNDSIYSVDVNLGEEGEVVNVGGEDEDVNLGGEGEVVNLSGESVDVNLDEEGEVVNLGGEDEDVNLGGEGVDDNLGGEGESDFLSKRRNKKKKATEYEEIPVGETGVRTQQQSSVCGDTTVVPRTTQTGSTMGGPSHSNFRTTYTTTQSSQPNSICANIAYVPRPPQKRFQVGTGRGLGRKKVNARGTPFVTERDNSSSQLLPLSGHKRPYSSTSFAPSTSSEKILHGPTKLKSASPTNIYIDFKPRGLKWKGKDAVSTSQLQQMKENRKNKGSCGTSKK